MNGYRFPDLPRIFLFSDIILSTISAPYFSGGRTLIEMIYKTPEASQSYVKKKLKH